MLKISVIDNQSQRRVVIEGALVEPWIAALRSSWQVAKADLQGRKLVLDLKNVTRISEEAESTLSELLREGARVSASGVLTKYLLRQLARRNKGSARQASTPLYSSENLGER